MPFSEKERGQTYTSEDPHELAQAIAEIERLRSKLSITQKLFAALLATTPEERQNPAIWFKRVDDCRAALGIT